MVRTTVKPFEKGGDSGTRGSSLAGGRRYHFKNTVHIGRKKHILKEKKENKKRRVGGDRRGLGEQDKATVKRERGCTSEGASRGKYRCHGNELKMYVTCCAWLNDRI